MRRYPGINPTMKPPLSATINWGHPWADGLVGCFLFNEGSSLVRDLVQGWTVPLTGAGAKVRAQFGEALDCQGVDAGVQTTSWNNLRSVVKEATILWRGNIRASMVNPCQLAGLTFANTDTSPFIVYNLAFNGTTKYALEWNNTGTFDFIDATPPVAWDGTERQVVGTLRAGTGNAADNALYESHLGNTRKLAQAGSDKTITPDIHATSQFGIGIYLPGFSGNSKTTCRHVFIWNRTLSFEEIKAVYIDPYAFLQAGRNVYGYSTAVASSVKFRRSLSSIGTRVGSRQVMQ